MRYNLKYTEFTAEFKKHLSPAQIASIYAILREEEIPLLDKEIFEEEFENPNFEEKQYSENIWDIVRNCLKPYQADILYRRFYLDETLREIGLAYGVTTERIRQIEAKALRMLKHPNRQPIKNIPDEYLHSDLWFKLYNRDRKDDDYGKPMQLEVSPIEEPKPKAISPELFDILQTPLPERLNAYNTLPSCSCGSLRGEYAYSIRCNHCGTIVKSPIEEPKVELPVHALDRNSDEVPIKIIYVSSNNYALRVLENGVYYIDTYFLEPQGWVSSRRQDLSQQ